MTNVSGMAAPTPPELEFWRGRALQTPTGLMDHDFGSSKSLQDKLVELPKSRSIGPVGVWRQRPLQNSSSGGVGAAILDTFITFEASQGVPAPIRPRAAHLSLGSLKRDECLEDGGSDPSRTLVLERSWPPNTDRADGSCLGEPRGGLWQLLRHRQGRWIMILQTPRASKSLQDPPK